MRPLIISWVMVLCFFVQSSHAENQIEISSYFTKQSHLVASAAKLGGGIGEKVGKAIGTPFIILTAPLSYIIFGSMTPGVDFPKTVGMGIGSQVGAHLSAGPLYIVDRVLVDPTMAILGKERKRPRNFGEDTEVLVADEEPATEKFDADAWREELERQITGSSSGYEVESGGPRGPGKNEWRNQALRAAVIKGKPVVIESIVEEDSLMPSEPVTALDTLSTAKSKPVAEDEYRSGAIRTNFTDIAEPVDASGDEDPFDDIDVGEVSPGAALVSDEVSGADSEQAVLKPNELQKPVTPVVAEQPEAIVDEADLFEPEAPEL